MRYLWVVPVTPSRELTRCNFLSRLEHYLVISILGLTFCIKQHITHSRDEVQGRTRKCCRREVMFRISEPFDELHWSTNKSVYRGKYCAVGAMQFSITVVPVMTICISLEK